MLKKRLIPILLLEKGRMVKTIRFNEKRDVGHPVTSARIYNAQGVDELIFLDITASREGRENLLDVLQRVSQECFMPLTVGGGVANIASFFSLLEAGADKVSMNTAAVLNPQLIREAAYEFGSQCVVISIDYKLNKDGRNEVFIRGGSEATGLDPIAWALEVEKLGAGELLLTCIDREGTLRGGYDLETLQMITSKVRIPVITNGGVGTLTDLAAGLVEGGASAVAASSIFHFTDQSPIKARSYLKTAQINIRSQ